MQVFTPLNETKTERLRFDAAEVEVIKGDLDARGYGKKADIKIADETYEVFGLGCGLGGCICDAYIKEVA